MARGKKRHHYTEEQVRFIRENFGKITHREIAEKTDIPLQLLYPYISYLKKKGLLGQAAAEKPDLPVVKAIAGAKIERGDLCGPVKKHYTSFHGKAALHTTERTGQSRGLIRNILTAQWLAFFKREENSDLTLGQVKAAFTDHLFREYGV